MNVKERLTKFILYKGLSVSEFERICGLSNGYVRKVEDSMGKRGLGDILRNFPELNGDWLLHGTGEMLKPNQSVTQIAGDNISNSTVNVNDGDTSLKERIKLLEKLVDEKERVIHEKERFIQYLLKELEARK